jgi:hypothetical protein
MTGSADSQCTVAAFGRIAMTATGSRIHRLVHERGLSPLRDGTRLLFARSHLDRYLGKCRGRATSSRQDEPAVVRQ